MTWDSHTSTENLGNPGRKFRVLVYAVLPPEYGWKGEGIAQTIEKILMHSPADIEYTLCISKTHGSQIDNRIKYLSNIKIRYVGFSFGKKQQYSDNIKTIKYVGKGNRFSTIIHSKLSKLTSPMRKILWLLYSVFLMILLKIEFRGFPVIYNPSPSFVFSGNKHQKRIMSFWDPFVFEFSTFNAIRAPMLRKFLYNFLVKSDIIITQSKSNKEYLTKVFSASEDKVKIVYNGSPDYSKLFLEFSKVFPELKNFSRDTMLELWPISNDSKLTRNELQYFLEREITKKSVLFRIFSKISVKSKIIMISTQYRPYKGLESLFQVLDLLCQKLGERELHFVFTSEFPDKIRDQIFGRFPWAVDKVYEFSRLTDLQHACMYCICDLLLHPSFVEGGPTLYPAAEAASLGKPSLTNSGRHTQEMIERDGPQMAEVVADFTRKEETVKRIQDLLTNADAARRNVELIRKSMIPWSSAAAQYAEVFRVACDPRRQTVRKNGSGGGS